MAQNTSTAVMARRTSAPDGLDDFPTQPWATRAFIENVFISILGHDPRQLSVWEPAANRRHMSKVLCEYFGTVHESDVFDYGAGVDVFDFLHLGPAQLPFLDVPGWLPAGVDWVITNPPFKCLTEFMEIAEQVTHQGVAMFCRTQCVEGEARYRRLYSRLAGHILFAQYVKRVAMVEGRLDRDAESATAYGWLIIDKTREFPAPLPTVTLPVVFIPPCREKFERESDYE